MEGTDLNDYHEESDPNGTYDDVSHHNNYDTAKQNGLDTINFLD